MGMKEFRAEIDRLDDQMAELLARRFDVIRRVAAFKASEDIPMMQPQRIDEILERGDHRAAHYGIDAALLRRLYQDIITVSCRVEESLIEQHRGGQTHPNGESPAQR